MRIPLPSHEFVATGAAYALSSSVGASLGLSIFSMESNGLSAVDNEVWRWIVGSLLLVIIFLMGAGIKDVSRQFKDLKGEVSKTAKAQEFSARQHQAIITLMMMMHPDRKDDIIAVLNTASILTHERKD